MKEDRSIAIAEDINWFMFGDNYEPIANKNGVMHNLEFVTWAGDDRSFIVADVEGTEYRITITRGGK